MSSVFYCGHTNFINRQIANIAIEYDFSESILQDYVSENRAEIERFGELLFLYGEEEDTKKMEEIDEDLGKSIAILQSKNTCMNRTRLFLALKDIIKLNAFA